MINYEKSTYYRAHTHLQGGFGDNIFNHTPQHMYIN